MNAGFLLSLIFAAMLLSMLPADAQQDSYSDTWVATDGLGRSLPTNAQTGPPRADKVVGMFYFLTFDHGQPGPYDNSKILAAHPEALSNVHNPAWGPLNSAHYWGEPLFGYYASDDEYVLRKHAQMLSAAGVDVVIFDNSNGVTYDKARNTLCRVWEQIRREGGQTPQIAFLCPFGNVGLGGSTLRELYETLYAPGLYSDLWFRWQGKPLVMAQPDYANAGSFSQPAHQPAELQDGSTLGQSFMATKPFTAAGGEFPTWGTTGSRVTLSLHANGPGGARLAQKTLAVADNATVMLDAGRTLPAGKYYLEMSRKTGQVGWWGYPSDVYSGGQAYDTGDAVGGDRTLHLRFADGSGTQTLSPAAQQITPEAAQAQAKKEAEFFTFRSPIPEYNNRAPQPGHWAWLQVYPQAPQTDPTGQIEQITVGVAQNYNAEVNHTAPMSFPGAFGRSYHDGKLDTRPNAVNYGFNFDEQWRQARKVDPPFVFVTGWNEWTAGFYEEWAGFHAPPVVFVDQFNQEFSRDIEPMTGGHGDNYYYQLVDNIRRYKGVRAVPPVVPAPIKMDGTFAAWRQAQPEFRNAISAPIHRDNAGFANGLRYTNTTGRNNILASKVSFDAHTVYFYVRTQGKLTPHTGRDWMRLYLNTDGDAKTGWLGYDYAVNGRVGSQATLLEKHAGDGYQWTPVGQARYQASGSEMAVAIPRALLGIQTLPATIDFKWADNCYAKGDWTDFLLNGDAAPIGRFNFRAILNP